MPKSRNLAADPGPKLLDLVGTLGRVGGRIEADRSSEDGLKLSSCQPAGRLLRAREQGQPDVRVADQLRGEQIGRIVIGLPGEGGDHPPDPQLLFGVEPGEVETAEVAQHDWACRAQLPIRLPPLRERREDIPALARELLKRIGRDLGRPDLRLDPEAERAVVSAAWPGNVRELANALERGAILAGGAVLGPSHISPSAPARGAEAGTLADLEREAISRALAEVEGNRRRAAERLGIGLRTLYEKLKRYDLG